MSDVFCRNLSDTFAGFYTAFTGKKNRYQVFALHGVSNGFAPGLNFFFGGGGVGGWRGMHFPSWWVSNNIVVIFKPSLRKITPPLQFCGVYFEAATQIRSEKDVLFMVTHYRTRHSHLYDGKGGLAHCVAE